MDKVNIEIDEGSGFCYGVVRAINRAEKILEEKGKLLSLGSIVHNSTEIERLASKGLITVKSLEGIENETVLIRAHGEPPATYQYAKEHNLNLIDCTCPVVLKLQQRIKERYEATRKEGGQIVIFGKLGHAEINGLTGQITGDAVVIEKKEDLDNPQKSNAINFTRGISLFSQTTKEPDEYEALGKKIREKIAEAGGNPENLKIYNTICAQVSSRHPNLLKFASSNDVIIFICGKESSNGKVLCSKCRSVNARTYKIEKSSEISKQWLEGAKRIGICGATSTPKWQLEEAAEYIRQLI